MGGQSIQTAREKFTKFLKILVTIATLQTQFVSLDAALKMTNRRVNALEFVLIPRIDAIISYIKQELDEIDREDFVRLKKTQEKKKKKKKQAGADAEKRAGGEATAANSDVQVEEEVIPSQTAFKDLEEEDDDIFV